MGSFKQKPTLIMPFYGKQGGFKSIKRMAILTVRGNTGLCQLTFVIIIVAVGAQTKF